MSTREERQAAVKKVIGYMAAGNLCHKCAKAIKDGRSLRCAMLLGTQFPVTRKGSCRFYVEGTEEERNKTERRLVNWRRRGHGR